MNRQVRPADFATPASPWRALIQRAGVWLVGVGVLIVIVLVALALTLGPLIADEEGNKGEDTTPAGQQDTVLWVRTNMTTGKAEGLTLFGKSAEHGTQVLFMPTGLYSLIPGVGTDQLGFASQYGGADLMAASVENLMGIHLDAVVLGSSEAIGAWIQEAGGLQVNVPDALTSRSGIDGSRRVIEKGDQFMTGPEVISYASVEQAGETEIDTFTRREVMWKHLAKVLAKKDVADKVLGEPMPHLTVARDASLVRPVLESLNGDNVAYSVLPIKPVGSRSGEETHYSPDWKAIRTLTESRWAGSLPEGSNGPARPIQILNGVGEPGVGQKVDARLAGLNLRVVVSENADTFSREQTEVVVYTDDAEVRKLGEEIVAKLGVGRLVKSSQPQSVVDVSIIVGSDFLAKEAERAAEAEAAAAAKAAEEQAKKAAEEEAKKAAEAPATPAPESPTEPAPEQPEQSPVEPPAEQPAPSAS